MRRRFHLLFMLLVLMSSAASVAHADPPLPLPRMPICGDQDGSEAPLVFRCPDFVPATDVQTYQVPGTTPIDLHFDFVFREATYNSELGYYLVDSASGTIDTLEPGDPGYLHAAMQRARVIFPSHSDARTPDVTIHFNAGDIIVFFIIQDNTLANFLANNPDNALNRSPLALFALDRLNPDHVDHLIGFTRANTIYSQFGFEDLTGGGDRDYDDIVYTITPALTPLTGRIALTPRSTRAQVAHSTTLVAHVTSSDGLPVVGTQVSFTVSGANSQNATVSTNQSGDALFTYTGTHLGQDHVVASAVVGERTSTSNTALVEWVAGVPGTLYITNGASNEITILDTASNAIVNTIPISNTAQGIVADRQGTTAYVANTTANIISVIDLINGQPIATLPVGEGPVIPALSTDETRLYVTNFASDSVSVIDTSVYSNSTTIPNVTQPWGVAASPDGTTFAVSLYSSGSVAIFDALTLEKITDIAVGSNPQGLIYHPTDSKLYVANLGSSSISVINTLTWQVSNTISVGTQPGNNPVQLTFNDDASRLYAADDSSGAATEIDVAAEEVIRHLHAGSGPRDVQVLGQYLYVTNANDDTVSVVDLNSGAPITTIPGFHQPHSIAAAAPTSPSYIVTGRVSDHNGLSKKDIIISDNAGHTTTTDANGNYTLHGLTAGQYTLSASYDGYTFLPGKPADRTLLIPDTRTLDFTAILEPLIFIPGITGSWLDQASGIPLCGIRNLWLGNLCSRAALNLDPNNIFRADNVIATDALREIAVQIGAVKVSYGIYTPLLDQISPLGYREYQVDNKPERRTFAGCDTANQKANHPNLFVYAYDWRLDNAASASLLDQYVTCIKQFYPNTRVNILTHSMGGLLARRYIIDHPGTVDKLITIAAPWLGAPKAIMALETGSFLGSSLIQAAATQLSDAEVKKLVEFFPGAHQLLPSAAYFALAGSPFGEQTYDSNGDDKLDPNYSYNQFIELMNKLHSNQPPATNSFLFHHYSKQNHNQDDWSSETSSQQGVRYYHLYGVQNTPATVGKLKAVNRQRCYPRAGCHTDKYDVDLTDGDGTVPAISAARSNDQSWGLNARGTTIVRVNGPNDDVEHTALAKNQNVIDYVRSVLQPASSQQNGVAQAEASNGETTLTSTNAMTTTAAYHLRIDGIRQMTITDSNGNTATMTNDTLVNTIPNLTDIHLGDASHMLIMPADQVYTFVLHSGAEPIAIDFTLRTDDTPTVAVRYLDLALPQGVNALLTLTPQTMEALRYDANNDGIYETTVPPTATVSGPLAGDVEPPVITMQRSGPPNNTAVTLTANDTGSGVKEIFYSLDGQTFNRYSGTLHVNVNQTSTIFAFADDKVANRSGLFSFPLALQSAPEPHIYIPVAKK